MSIADQQIEIFSSILNSPVQSTLIRVETSPDHFEGIEIHDSKLLPLIQALLSSITSRNAHFVIRGLKLEQLR